MKAVLCRCWKVPLWDFEHHAATVPFKEVMETIDLELRDPIRGPGTLNYLFPNTVNHIKNKKKAANNNVQFAKLLPMVQPKNDEERWFLDNLKDQLNKEVQSGA